MGYFLGAYATQPPGLAADPELEAAWLNGLSAFPGLRGLEIPFDGRLHPLHEALFLDRLDPAWDLVLTCLPGTMDRLARQPSFGLASTEEAGRREALSFAEQARQAVFRLNRAAGRRRVVAVELHSAPRLAAPRPAASSALARSLRQLVDLDWDGAALVLEHCDAWTGRWPAAKGFLTLEEEIQAIGVSGEAVGMAVNWARSVLEARDPQRGLDHIRQAGEAGLLKGVIFSGCSGADGPWGAWQDSHMPHATSEKAPLGAPHSLLTEGIIAACLAALPPEGLLYVGGKITARPPEAGLDHRLALNAELLDVLARAAGRSGTSFNRPAG